MAKDKIVFECTECGEKHTKWQGKCNSCNSWNCLVESVEISAVKTNNTRFSALNKQSVVVTLNEKDDWKVHKSLAQKVFAKVK